MSSPQEKCFLYLFGIILLCSGIWAKPSINHFPKDVSQFQSRGYSVYPLNYQVILEKMPGFNFTGFRSAFQWTVGKSVSSIQGVQNALEFTIDDATNETIELTGEIGFNSKGSEIGLYFSMDAFEKRNFPGLSFYCSNGFNFSAENNACFNSNFSLISNAIYFLDVEIRDKTIRGYISIPVNDLTDIDDPYLPRYLIAEIKYIHPLTKLDPQSYWVGNYYGRSCDNLSEITTFNFQVQSYDKVGRFNRYFTSSMTHNYLFCDAENIVAVTNWSRNIGVFISKPPAQINGTRSANFLE